MVLASSWLDWFTGGPNHRYNTLFHCMDQDVLWITITVVLDLAVATGYSLIAMHWWKNARHLPPSPAKRALGNIRNIFVFCGICGYLFIPVKMVWPAWRLYDMFMVALAYFTWRYAWGAKDLKVIYNEMGRTARLAEDLEKTREESKRKGFFLNAISHDLRTPLNGMLLQANLAELGAKTNDPATVISAVAGIKAGARAAAELLDSLLEYARLDGSQDRNTVEAVDVGEAVRAAVGAAKAAADEKGLALRGGAPSDLNIQTDRVKLGRVLANLISNAIKFTPAGEVRVEAERTGAAVQIHVTDTGVGIAAADRARLFEEFFQASNIERDRKKGFGLGLAIARRLARQLGGDITVDSAEGRGSCFTVVLPLVAPAVPPHASAEADDDDSPTGAALGANVECPRDGSHQAHRNGDGLIAASAAVTAK